MLNGNTDPLAPPPPLPVPGPSDFATHSPGSLVLPATNTAAGLKITDVRCGEERSDELRRSVFWVATYAADASVRNVATINFRHCA